MKRWLFIALAGLLPGIVAHAAQVGLIKIDGAIGPATASYISRAIDVATAQSDECLIIQLDTPGGLLDSASEIVQKFYASKVPIVVYVSPAPARAGSAGVFITMAADVAVMAPHTRIGAAHPVELGASGERRKDRRRDEEENRERHRQLRPIHRRKTQSQRGLGQVRRARQRLHHGGRGAGQERH